ncbi:gap junction alpha-5 protein [Platysternon megacephalum]|uniref:Gap junction alpha-5 protein n=1 Tax=Platysternon megacephalum TaxID=55544 RepID=A0A4D9ECX8_9SAUR|nr:gap junction alpha-5 protein [Platysternon megacephalum]
MGKIMSYDAEEKLALIVCMECITPWCRTYRLHMMTELLLWFKCCWLLLSVLKISGPIPSTLYLYGAPSLAQRARFLLCLQILPQTLLLLQSAPRITQAFMQTSSISFTVVAVINGGPKDHCPLEAETGTTNAPERKQGMEQKASPELIRLNFSICLLVTVEINTHANICWVPE